MKHKIYRRFKDDIRITFITYALIPMLIIVLVSYVAYFFIWYGVIAKENRENNFNIATKLENIFSTYMDTAKSISEDPMTLAFIKDKKNSVLLYEKLYNIVNNGYLEGEFHIFNKDMDMIASSITTIPHYAKRTKVFSWGLPRSMKARPNDVVIEVSSKTMPSSDNEIAICIGKAIVEEGQIIGYMTFDFYKTDIMKSISNNLTSHVVLTDKYNNVVVSTNLLHVNSLGKFDADMRLKSGLVYDVEGISYTTKNTILSNKISIYSISYVGYLKTTFILFGLFLIFIFLLLFIMLFTAAKKIANDKTKVIDDLIKALGRVQNGEFDTELILDTNDEFQIIADSFNRMVKDIKELMEINKEKAQQNVISEIMQLESQFNPHFLFNTLETIRVMVKLEPTAANKMIISLATLLRYSINNTLKEATLEQDVEYTKHYLMLQKYRFNNRLEYKIKIQEEAYPCIIPKLIIQPIIENAIIYGFENQDNITIKISATIREGKLIIVIYDDGQGMTLERLKEIRELLQRNKNTSRHIGLYNVHRRIRLMYGEPYGIEVISERLQGTVVKIILPVAWRV